MPRIRADGGLIGRTNDPTALVASGMWSLKSAEKANRAALWPTAAYSGSTDPYFNLTSLLIHADGVNGANNSVFVDSSSNLYTITSGGKPMQGTFTPFSPTGWSAYLGGSSSLTAPYSSTNYAFHTTDFTVEAWIYPTSYTNMAVSVSNIPTLIGSLSFNSNVADWSFGLNNSGALQFYYYNGSSISIVSSTTVPLNTWSHIAMTKTSSGISLFYNGSLVSGPTAVQGTPSVQGGTTLTFGAFNGTSVASCYISNVRILKGTALYSGSYTVPTTALTAITNTTFLGFQDNKFDDNSSIAATISVNGTAASVQAFSPFAPLSPYSSVSQGGSTYFNGTTDFLTLPNNMTVVGSNAYTLEGWFYPSSVSAVEIPLVKLYNATQTIELRIVSNKIQGRINGSATIVGGNTTLAPNQWYHFALVKPSSGTSTAVLYLNGVAESTTASDTTTYTAFTTPRIGANQTPNIYYTGWVAGVRFLNGNAQYTSNFTPPTTPFTSDNSTLFLVNSTNANVIDNSTRNNITTGTASISTTQSKFGGSSISFNGTTDYLQFKPGITVPQNSAYTFECWFYLNNTTFSTYYTLLGQSIGGTGGQLNIRIVNTTTISVDQLGLSAQSFTIPALSAGQWYHIAVTRNASNGADVWLNGTKSSTGTVTMDKNYPAASDTIGANNDAGLGKYFPGYIDDIRFTIGYARYTANFNTSTYIAFLNS